MYFFVLTILQTVNSYSGTAMHVPMYHSLSVSREISGFSGKGTGSPLPANSHLPCAP